MKINKTVVALVALVVFCSFAISVQSQGPVNVPPDFWMDTLNEIYNAVMQINDKITPVPSQGPPLPQTGQTLCYDETGTVRDCVGTGEDGEFQYGEALPDPRFTINAGGTVTDNLTGRMWLQDANCIATQYPEFDDTWGTAGDGSVTWQEALDFVAGINDGTYPNCGAGYTDWHLPNIRELFSLIDFGNSGPALPSGAPFFNLQSLYWSSTTVMNSPGQAWGLFPFQGSVTTFSATDKDFPTWGLGNYVWPVRGGN